MDKKMVPEVRFKGFYDDWEQVKFERYISKAGIKNGTHSSHEVYSVSNSKGLVLQNEQFENNRLAKLDKSSYKIVKPTEFVYNPARINVGSIAYNDTERNIMVSSLYVILSMNNDIDDNFIKSYIESKQFQIEVRKNTEGTVRQYLFFDNFKNIKFPYVNNLNEQRRIAKVIQCIDETITLQQQQLDLYTKLKKGLLQKLFPKDGEKVPDVRFADFTGNWEQRKFNSFIIKSGERNNKDISYDIYSVNNKKGLINQDSQFEKGRLSRLNKKMYKMVKPSEFVYNPARINVGSIAYNNLGISVMVSSLYVVFRLNEKIDDNFTMSFIKSKRFTDEVMRNTEGSV
ncbi:restriction endonuclease subunit S, partial [Companilactobacillus farciminis]|uniref:restriction endonuclease subunit S n=1 Tax=Companilactobacillus farciminis TaxID=1612 RepID=UPI00241D5A89